LQNSDRALYSLIVAEKEFWRFLQKFVGLFIYRGNKARAVKFIDKLLHGLKRELGRDPMVVLYLVYLKLFPLFSITYRRMGNRYQPVPKLAAKSVRCVLVLDWLVRGLKGKSNRRGVRANDVVALIVDTYHNRGRALALKKAFYKRALSGRHLLSSYKVKNRRFNFKKKRKQGIEF